MEEARVPVFESLQPHDPSSVGPYRLESRLGAGGMGRVFLGRSRSGRVVAVKVVHPELAADRDFRQRFAREITLARTVSGFFTAEVVDADPEGTPPWLATAYVPGMSLDAAVGEYGPWPERDVLALGAGLAEALESIHAAGVVHRDLKPSNVLLGADGPRVIDFGISVAVEGSRLTRTGIAIGTPGFVSPEQLTGAPVGPAADVFCLGAVLAFAATATGPFGGGSWQGLWYRTVHEEPDLAALPPRLRPLVERCLAKSPADRPTASALLDQMAGHLGHGDRLAGLYAGAGWLPEPVAEVVRTLVMTAAPEDARATVTDLPPRPTRPQESPQVPASPQTRPAGAPSRGADLSPLQAAAAEAAARRLSAASSRAPGNVSPLRAAAAAAAARRLSAAAARPSGQGAATGPVRRNHATRPGAHGRQESRGRSAAETWAEATARRAKSRVTMLLMMVIPLLMLAVAVADALTA
ncbi:serine/threonine-protein kinase [Nonomuraea maritima]|uniref:serine/threonine-protein kinase n=1 Tax=Nonomuraea maritima TaxID=683260 RepID=UPI001C40AD46|nr:serine/threonine-protein kinase [Nonomuraea maritima]